MGDHASAAQMADDVRAGRRTAAATVSEALQRIADRDGDLEAFQVVRVDRALAEAAAVDGRSDRADLPLAGVPVAIKDNVPVAGEPMRVGSAATSDARQPLDHPVVKRIRDAGGVVVGITRVPELCVFGATDSVYGVTRNPWDLTKTPGGSSGGSAAAVASGMVPVAHGNDGMGSVRIPAACTGLVGIKPGRGVVPAELGETDWFGLSENGVLATTVGDAALLLSVMAGDPQMAQVRDIDRRLHVGLSMAPPVAGVAVDPGWAAAAERLAALMADDGHDVQRDDPTSAWDPAGNAAAVAGLVRWFAGTAADADAVGNGANPAWPSEGGQGGAHVGSEGAAALERRIRRHAMLGRLVRRTPLMSERLREAWIRRAGEYFAVHDVLITPALAQPPIDARRWHDGGWAASMFANIRYAPFAAPWNVAGFPAMVVPMGVHPDTGTPVAAQIVGAPGGESLLLSVAAAVERQRPWERLAPVYA